MWKVFQIILARVVVVHEKQIELFFLPGGGIPILAAAAALFLVDTEDILHLLCYLGSKISVL